MRIGNRRGLIPTSGINGMRAARLLIASLALVPFGGRGGSQEATWASLTDRAIAAFESIDTGDLGVHAYAWAAGAAAIREGWDSAKVDSYLDGVYRQQNSDGGYGIEYAWDAFQDGTVNSADTTYAITLTDHVGPVFLDGWEAGEVPRWRVEQLIANLAAMPRVDTPVGTCVAYSTAPPDTAFCVNNVNASAAFFLDRAGTMGFDVPPGLVDDIMAAERSTFIPGLRWWPYSSASPALGQDWNHEATSIEAALTLAPDLGAAALDAIMQPDPVTPRSELWDSLGWVRLLPFNCAASDVLNAPGQFDALLDTYRDDAHRLALMAYMGALAAKACD